MTKTLALPALLVLAPACATEGGSDDASGDTDAMGTTTEDPSTSGSGPGTGPGSMDSTMEAGESESDDSAPPGTELANCRELHENDPAAPDGIYPFYPAGDPDLEPFDAYCDMTTDGGGWTLVGRSVEGKWDIEFGWNSTTGAPDNSDLPYSLGAADAELEVSEILLGSRMEGMTWGPDVYKMHAPDLYVFLYRQVPYMGMVETVVGDCAPDNGPTHLQYHGWTDDTALFRFMQYEFDSTTGLRPAGFATAQDDCAGGGNLNGLQGMVMAR
jgi:hypothetical protein